MTMLDLVFYFQTKNRFNITIINSGRLKGSDVATLLANPSANPSAHFIFAALH